MNDNTQKSVALESLGCKLNQAEIQQMAYQLQMAGYRLVDGDAKADIYILNTCTVTHVADSKSRHLLRLAHRRNPDARIIAVGCYAHRIPQELASIEGVDLVLGNEDKANLIARLEDDQKTPKYTTISGPQNHQRTRAFFKVQDGCRNYCSYCIVPYVRTREFSVPVGEVQSRLAELVSEGFQEVVLTGTEIGTYNTEGLNLEGLLKSILQGISIHRLRLSSLQPHQISSSLIELWHDPRLCPHFHLSLQSGSDAVLKRMKRRYTTSDYVDAVDLIRGRVPFVAITTDVIVGFPGETESEFQETLEFCRRMKFSRIHIFQFSPRPGTAAASILEQVAIPVKKARSKQMLLLARESSVDFRRSFIGNVMEVLWEQVSRDIWSGLTGNYIKVYTKYSGDLSNTITTIKLNKIYRDGLWGDISRTITDSISP
jgi:threonylcarbamoyladenosine tRNA methylthiotransferase MtaB